MERNITEILEGKSMKRFAAMMLAALLAASSTTVAFAAKNYDYIEFGGWVTLDYAVSYTHLDVYKRQGQRRAGTGPGISPEPEAAAAEPPAGRQEPAGFVDAYSSTSKNFVKILGNFEYTNPAQVWYNLKL